MRLELADQAGAAGWLELVSRAALEKEPVSEIRWNTVRAAIKSMSSPEFG